MTEAKPNVLSWRRELFGHHIPTHNVPTVCYHRCAAALPSPRHAVVIPTPYHPLPPSPPPPPQPNPHSGFHKRVFLCISSPARPSPNRACVERQPEQHTRATHTITYKVCQQPGPPAGTSSQAPPRARRNGTTQEPASDACVTPPHTRRRPHSEWLPARAREASAACSSNTTNRAGHGGN